MTLSSIESKDRDSKRSMIPALVFKDQYKVIFVLATLKRGDKCLTGTTRRRLNFSSKKSFKRCLGTASNETLRAKKVFFFGGRTNE